MLALGCRSERAIGGVAVEDGALLRSDRPGDIRGHGGIGGAARVLGSLAAAGPRRNEHEKRQNADRDQERYAGPATDLRLGEREGSAADREKEEGERREP